MTSEQKAAYIFSQAVCALAEIEGMKAGNSHRLSTDGCISYDDEAFFAVAEKYGLGHNSVISLFQEP
jgi:hypothetical protein